MNPYAAPRPPEAATYAGALPQAVHASHAKRFAGALVDMMFGFVVAVAARTVVGAVTGQSPPPSMFVLFTCIAHLVNFVLLTTRAQSVGKIVCGTKIIRADGLPAGPHQTIVLRALPLVGLTFVSAMIAPLMHLAGLVQLADGLAIAWNGEHRTLHDRLAGTIVIDLKASSYRAS